jgi:demethylmenaquinone methyltransferase/2-methoxy-6-polyprenyl-1,4-benzoquinol methylase
VTVSTSKEPARIAAMFDGIARRYDTLNRVLSLGLDQRWRRRAVRALALTGRERVLDLCTGTADLALGLAQATPPAARVVGVDFAPAMLTRARHKVARAGLSARVALVRGDATAIPLDAGTVDAATIAFGIRNVVDPARACREIARVLRPGGRLVVLEFGRPRIPGISTLYRWYFRYLLPLVGRFVSRHREAYSYLPASVEAFPTGDAFVAVLHEAGFSDGRHVSLTAGIVYMYTARKAG